jgi:hypothetical protein
MSGEKHSGAPFGNPVERVFRISALLLGAVIALNLAVAFLQPILPWLLGGAGLAALGWATAAIVRWRRSRW